MLSIKRLGEALDSHSGPFLDLGPTEFISFEEARDESARIGAWLSKRGVKRGDSVATAMKNTGRAVIPWFGLLRSGVAVVPVNPSLRDEELAYILRMSEAKLIICDSATHSAAMRWAQEVGTRIEVILAEDRPWQEYAPAQAPYVDPEDIAVIFFTSGTTGRPKGAMLSHRALISNALGCRATFSLDRSAAFACPIPIFHAFAATVCVFLPAILGGRTYLHSPLDPAGFVRTVPLLPSPRVLIAVPSLLAALASVGEPLRNIRFCVSGGAALQKDIRAKTEALISAMVYEGYGTTECGPVISSQGPRLSSELGSVGQAISGVEVQIRSSDGNIMASGEIGEIVVRTPALMLGYYDLARATEASIKGGWFHTGDLGYLSDRREVFIVDRLTDAITVKGITLLPQMVEALLNAHPAVAESAVVGIPDGSGGEVPWAFVRCRGEKPSAGEIIDYAAERLPVYAVPRSVEFRDELPKTITGKILKRTLRQKWL